jgi:cyanate permease
MVPTTFILLFGDKRFSPDMLLQVSAFAICWGNVFGGISPFITGALTTRFGIAMMPLLPAIIIAISMLFTRESTTQIQSPRI